MAELSLVEFPADDPERARMFWEGLLGRPLAEREDGEGQGRQTRGDAVAVGIHERGRGRATASRCRTSRSRTWARRSSACVSSEARSSTRASGGRSAATPRAARSGSPPSVLPALDIAPLVGPNSWRSGTGDDPGDQRGVGRSRGGAHRNSHRRGVHARAGLSPPISGSRGEAARARSPAPPVPDRSSRP